ncbi:hypothetical protein SAMN05444167_0554 [Terriglobus roseus]|uniref:Uncharacterized protein n=1 Tax=Terriglobus roseus TaxID=392734 RepID=A0A1G7G551_9BACT|nr:hypothetical protein SAMN05444167_0554 [Terriglobus roseus]
MITHIRVFLALLALTLAIATNSLALCGAFLFIATDIYLSLVQKISPDEPQEPIVTNAYGFRPSNEDVEQ